MAINKVVYGTTILVDLTNDTVTADTLAEGYTAHDKQGNVIIGTMVSGGGSTDVEDSIITRTITEITNDRVQMIGDYAFASCSSLTSVTSADFPAVTEIGHYGFSDCSSLTSVNFPLVDTVKTYTFQYCEALATADFPSLTEIRQYSFRRCYTLTSLILRSSTVCTLQHTNAFSDCYHILGTTNSTYNPSGLNDGYIYVPDNLVESYKTATNWTYFSSQIKSISELR